MKFLSIALAGLVSSASAQNIVTQCAPENNGVCYSLHVPSPGPSTAKGDIYMQLAGPSSIPWLGLGQSTEATMAGANIFIVYPASDGKNVTISSRQGLGDFGPKATNSAKLRLLSGSGISDGKMVANILCSNCDAWAMGSMDMTDKRSTWIYAYGPTTRHIHTNNNTAPTGIHDGYGAFRANLPAATGGDPNASAETDMAEYNPFAGRAIPNSSSKKSISMLFYNDVKLLLIQSRVAIAHGVLGGLAFGLLLPLGSMLMRLGAAGARTWKVHAGVQLFGFSMAWVVLGLGVWMAMHQNKLRSTHSIIGLVVVSGVGALPLLGWMQHLYFVKVGKRTAWGIVHAYFGRAVLVLGIVNVPLGLKLVQANEPTKVMRGYIAYGTLVGLVGTAWIAVILWSRVQRLRDIRAQSGDRESGSVGGSDFEKSAARSESDVEEGVQVVQVVAKGEK